MSQESEYLIAIFAETNQHMRVTEQKQVSISVAFFGVVAVVLSVLPNNDGKLLNPGALNFFVYILLLFTGCTVFSLQRWYRVWKEHYMQVIQRIVGSWEINQELLPEWIKLTVDVKKSSKFKLSADNLPIYFSFIFNTFLILFGSFRWLEWRSFSCLAWVSVSVLVVSYCLFTRWVFKMKVAGEEGHNA